jgi:hypothetical protein
VSNDAAGRNTGANDYVPPGIRRRLNGDPQPHEITSVSGAARDGRDGSVPN